MASSFSTDVERVSIPVETYLFDIGGGGDTYLGYPDKLGVLTVVRDVIQRYDGRLRRNINLRQRSYSDASDKIAGELAVLAYVQRRGFNNPVNAAHLFRMASGAERVSRDNSGNHNEVIKTERAALELIYMADAVQALQEAGKGEAGFVWRREQGNSLKVAYRMIQGPVRAGCESPSPHLLDRVGEAYLRGKLIIAGI